MSLFDEIASDTTEILSEIGKPVLWKGKKFNALVSENEISQELAVGGFVESVDFTVKFHRSNFRGEIPKHGDLVTYLDNEYRIVRLTNRPPHPYIIADLQSKEK